MISDAGLELIKRFEGCRLEAYPDPASGGEPYTIGYGHTNGVSPGQTCTQEQADAWLREDAQEASIQVLQAVKVQLSQDQLDALTSFVFNLGIGNFKSSTLLRKLNAGDFRGAGDEFLRWNKAAGKVMPGLTKRRQAERALFLTDQPEKPVLPLLPIVSAFLPSLVQAAPALIRVFGDSPQAEKNAQAAEIVANIAKASTGEPTLEGATTAIANEPEKAAAFREAVHQSMPELLSTLLQASQDDDRSRDAALDRNVTLAKETGGKWLYLLAAVALIVVGMSYAITWGVMFKESSFSDETKAMLLGQIVILGFVTVLGFLYGSNIQNRITQSQGNSNGNPPQV